MARVSNAPKFISGCSSVLTNLILSGAVVAFLILSLNMYGAWYVAYRTGSHGWSGDEIDAEIVTRDPEMAKEERRVLAALKPLDVRVEPGQLRAWYLPGQKNIAGWVLVHGAGDNRTTNIRLASALNAQGASVLSLELSYAHNGVFSGGSRESEEIIASVKWLNEQTTGPKPFLYGCSTGAFNVLVAVAQGAPVSGVVADSGFVSFPRMSAQQSHLPYLLFRPMAYLFPIVGEGGELVDIEYDYVAADYRVPTLIINGTGDTKVSPMNGPHLAKITGGELWAPENVGHCTVFDERPEEFFSHISAMAETERYSGTDHD